MDSEVGSYIRLKSDIGGHFNDSAAQNVKYKSIRILCEYNTLSPEGVFVVKGISVYFVFVRRESETIALRLDINLEVQ